MGSGIKNYHTIKETIIIPVWKILCLQHHNRTLMISIAHIFRCLFKCGYFARTWDHKTWTGISLNNTVDVDLVVSCPWFPNPLLLRKNKIPHWWGFKIIYILDLSITFLFVLGSKKAGGASVGSLFYYL